MRIQVASKDSEGWMPLITDDASKPMARYWYPWLDSVKGIGILFVVMGHTCTYAPLFRWIYSFHMALFFIVSGLLFRPKPFVLTAKRKAFRLLVPYAFFATIMFLYWALLERRMRHGSQSVLNAFLNLFLARAGSDNYPQNAVLWFLPCLFVTEMLFLVIYRGSRFLAMRTRSKTLVQRITLIVIAACCLAAGYTLAGVLASTDIRLPWVLDIVPFSLAFVIIGYLAQPLLGSCDGISRHPGVGLRFGLIALSLLGFSMLWLFDQATGLVVNFNEASISNPVWMLVASLIGLAATMVLCLGIDNPVLRYLGSASLTIMCVHEPVKRVVIELLGRALGMDDSLLRVNLFACLLVVAVTVLICLAGHVLLGRFAPILIGKKRRAGER